MLHDLKIHPEYFLAVLSGEKSFEVRRNDRDYKVGDFLLLRLFDLSHQCYTGRWALVRVTYILSGAFGLSDDFCVMSIVPVVDGK